MGCDIHMLVQQQDRHGDRRNKGEWYTAIEREATYSDRNYTLFAVLAGVRESNGEIPIAQPRGLPPGMKKLDEEKEYLGEHSFSWLSLAEIKAYNWDAEFTQRGVLSAFEAAKLIYGKKPDSWCAGVFGGSTQVVTALRSLYLQEATWQRTYREACATFLEWIAFLENNTRLRYAPNGVRFVFGFDS